MKIKIEKVINTTENRVLRQRDELVRFQLVDSVLKTHFKTLMKLSRLYDPATKIGYITKENEPEFHALAEKIEASNTEQCRKSHEKTRAKKAEKRNRITFEDYCEDWLDQHIALMGESEKTEAFKSFQHFMRGDKNHRPDDKIHAETKTNPLATAKNDMTEAVFKFFNENGFEIQKGENDRYFIARDGKTQGELIGILNNGPIYAKFDKIEFGTTISIPQRSAIHQALAELYA
jgi:hypothetical protein